MHGSSTIHWLSQGTSDPAIHISGKVPQQMGVVDGERTPERFDHNGTLMYFQYLRYISILLRMNPPDSGLTRREES